MRLNSKNFKSSIVHNFLKYSLKWAMPFVVYVKGTCGSVANICAWENGIALFKVSIYDIRSIFNNYLPILGKVDRGYVEKD